MPPYLLTNSTPMLNIPVDPNMNRTCVQLERTGLSSRAPVQGHARGGSCKKEVYI